MLFRSGWALGREDVIESLGRIKTNIDSGIFEAVQYAGIEALENPGNCIEKNNKLYTERRDLLVNNLQELGWDIEKNKASFYLWVKVPEAGVSSQEFSRKVFQDTGVFFTPGHGYGEYGEGFIRIALTVKKDRIEEACSRLAENGFKY